MPISETIKENVRAVLLSKTDGRGVLVSRFLQDYKSIIHDKLIYKNMGYSTLEEFVKDIPDVCRLEYSESEMAYKLFGIAKPNMYQASFSKRAEGMSDSEDVRRPAGKKGKIIKPSQNLDEDWEPNTRGLYSICFPNRDGNGLDSKQAVAVRFAQLGEVVEINVIPKMTFVRFRDQYAAKKALQLWGDELKIRRAEERAIGAKNKEQGQRGRGRGWDRNGSDNRDDEPGRYKGRGGDSEPGRYKGPGGDGGSNKENWQAKRTKEQSDAVKACKSMTNGNDDDDSILAVDMQKKDYIRGLKRSEDRGLAPKKVKSEEKTIPEQKDVIQVYIGNWPNVATEMDLMELINPFNTCGHRIMNAKGSIHKQFAFVDTESESEAYRMVEELNNTVLMKRNLQVRLGNRSGGPSQGAKSGVVRSGRRSDDELSTTSSLMNGDAGDVGSTLERMSVKSTSSSSHSSTSFGQKSPYNKCSLLGSPPPLIGGGRRPMMDMPPLENCLSSDMPELEGDYDDDDDMPQLEGTVVAENEANGSGGQVQLFIGNFPYGTVEHELVMLFQEFGVTSFQIMNQNVTNRSTYAFATVADEQQAQMAILSLDQSKFKGRRLTVAMTTPGASTKAPVSSLPSSQLARITCTVGGDIERRVSVEGSNMSHMANLSQISPIQAPSETSTIYRRDGGFNFYRLTTVLRNYNMVVTKLCGTDQFNFPVGTSLKVLVTYVENNKFFWGQILSDSMKGTNRDLDRVLQIMSSLQVPENRTRRQENMGRCTALFEGEWYRAWNTCKTERDGVEMGDVFFVDYGNTALIPKSQIFLTQQDTWTVPPVAKPFKLSDHRQQDTIENNQVITLDVVDVEMNYVIVVQARLD